MARLMTRGTWPIASELVPKLKSGARHAVIRSIAKIGVRGMCDLRHHVPVSVEPEAGANVLVEKYAATKGWAVIIAIEFACMDDTAETRLSKQFVGEVGCP